jgi:hypothetical protein
VAGKLQEGDETGYVDPAKKEPVHYYQGSFSDSSSGYYDIEQVCLMQQYGIPIASIDTTASFHITFTDGSSGYYNTEQVNLMLQYGIPITSVD